MDQEGYHSLLVLPLILFLFLNPIGKSEGMKVDGEIVEESASNSQLKQEDENFHNGRQINSISEGSTNLGKMFTGNSSLGKTVSFPLDLGDFRAIHSDQNAEEDDGGWKHWVEKVKNRNDEELKGAKKNKKELIDIKKKHEHQLINHLLGNNGNNQPNHSKGEQQGNGQSSTSSRKRFLSRIWRKHHRKTQSYAGEKFVGSSHSSVANSPLNLSCFGQREKAENSGTKTQRYGGEEFHGSSQSSLANSPSILSRFGQREMAESSGTKTPTLKGKLTWPQRLRNANSSQLEKAHSMDSNYRKQKELGNSPHRSKSMDYLERLEELGRVGQQRPILSLRQSEAIRKEFKKPILASNTSKIESHSPMSSPTNPQSDTTENEEDLKPRMEERKPVMSMPSLEEENKELTEEEPNLAMKKETHLSIRNEKKGKVPTMMAEPKENMASMKDGTFGKETIDENNNGSSGSSNDLEYEIVDGEMSRIAKLSRSGRKQNIGIEQKQSAAFYPEILNLNAKMETENESNRNVNEMEENGNDEVEEKSGSYDENKLVEEAIDHPGRSSNKVEGNMEIGIKNDHPNEVHSQNKGLDHPESYLIESISNKLAVDDDGNHHGSHILHHKSHHDEEGKSQTQNNEDSKLNEINPKAKENQGMSMELAWENAKNSAVPFNEDGESSSLIHKKNNNHPFVDHSAGQQILNSQNLAYEWLEEVSKPKSIKTPIEPGLSTSADNSPHKSTHNGSSGSPKIKEGDRALSSLFERYKKQRNNGHRRQGSLSEIFEPVGLQHVVNEEKRMESLMKINSVKWNQLNVKEKAEEFEVEFGGKPRNEME